MKIEKVDYRSDFTLKIRVKDILKAPLTLSSYDFDGVITSDESNKSYAFSRKDGKCSENCLVDNSDDSLVIVKFYDFDLSPGRLVLTFTLYVIDETFPNGIRKDVAQCRLNVKLTDGKCPIEYSIENVELVLSTIKGQKGDKGDKGDQGLQGVQGAQGERGLKGDKGEKGDAFTYADFTPEQLAALKGPKGDKGDPGSPGAKGEKGDVGTLESNSGATIGGDCVVSGAVKTSTITPSTGSGGVVEVDGQLVTKGWGVVAGGDSTVNGNLFVNRGVYAQGAVSGKKMQLGDVDVNTLIVREFHGIRNSIPDGLIATTEKVTTATQGGLYDIVYIRALKRFVALTETAYAARFNGDDNYNVLDNDTSKTARTDRVWRWGNDLYRYDTEAYISQYVGWSTSQSKYADILAADLVQISEKTDFIRQWREAIIRPMLANTLITSYGGQTDAYGNQNLSEDYGGYYPPYAADEGKTPGFYINGIFGISYDEARQIYAVRTYGPYPPRLSNGGSIRTNMLCQYNGYEPGGGQDSVGINTAFVFSSYDASVIRVAAGLRGQRPTDRNNSAYLRGALSFYTSDKLEEVIGAIYIDSEARINSVNNPFGDKLQYLWISGLKVSLSKCFVKTANLNLDCLAYLVEKSRASASAPITIKLHADLFARLTDELITAATAKYITFVSA